MSIEIKVIEKNGEHLFEAGGLTFDRLLAQNVFEGCSLKITREDRLIDQTDPIKGMRIGGSRPSFISSHETPSNIFPKVTAADAISASELKVGDQMELNIDLTELAFAGVIEQRFRLRLAVLRSKMKDPPLLLHPDGNPTTSAGNMVLPDVLRFPDFEAT